jgi:predicted phosphodiesterase
MGCGDEPVAFEVIRILSDLHYGDRASRVRSLAALIPLFGGADRIVFNGDSLDTRIPPSSQRTPHLHRHFLEFIHQEVPGAILLTGNHDADISDVHHLDLLGGIVFVTHGEILFEDLVPWSREQPEIGELYRQQLAALPAAERNRLEARLDACKRACVQLRFVRDPQPRGPWRRTMQTAATFWPPRRTFAMIRAWRELPARVAAAVRCHRPRARFAIVGHTHLPGVWYQPDVVVINTGSFCPPFGGYAVDVSPEEVVVRRVRQQGRQFCLGRVVASFALAPTGDGLGDASAIAGGLVPAP